MGAAAVTSIPTKEKFGALLAQHGFISEQQLQEALQHQERSAPHKRLGEICVDLGFISTTVLRVVLDRYRNHNLLGALLLRMGVVSADRLSEALSEQRKGGKRLGQILLDKRYVTKADLAEALSIQLGIPKIVPNVYMVDPMLLAKAAPQYFRKHRVVPLSRVVVSGVRSKEIVTVLMEDPLDTTTIADLGKVFSAEIRPAVSATMDIEDFLNETLDSLDRGSVANLASALDMPVFQQTEEMALARNDVPASQVGLEKHNYSITGLTAQGDGTNGTGKEGMAYVKILSSPQSAPNGVRATKTSDANLPSHKQPETSLTSSATWGMEKSCDLLTKNANNVELPAKTKDMVIDEEDSGAVKARRNAVTILNSIVSTAVKERARDIHIEPLENRVCIRYGADGVLKHEADLPKPIAEALTTRVKTLSGSCCC